MYDLAANSSPTHSTPTGGTVEAMVAIINTWSGYHATLTASTNALNSSFLSRADLGPSEAIPKTALSGTAHITRIADIHADQCVWYGPGLPVTYENIAIRFFEARKNVSTAWLSVPDSGVTALDWGLRNVSNSDISASVSVAGQPGVWAGTHSHVVIEFNSSTAPAGRLLTDTFDTYSAIDHTAEFTFWRTVQLPNLHLTSLASPALPTGADANSKSVSTNQALLYTAPSADPPDFTPLSPLRLTDLTYAGRLRANGTEQGT